MPGVIVTSNTRTGGSAIPTPESGRYFLTGLFERGPVTPTVVASLTDFYSVYGEVRPTYSFAWDDVVTYFREGGGEAVIRRVVGPGATTGTLTLNNAANTPSVRLDATSAGAWSSTVAVTVVAGAITNTVTVTLLVNGEVSSRFSNLANVADLVDALNRTRLVKATVLGSALPKVSTITDGKPVPTALSAGSDDRVNVNATRLVDALSSFTAEFAGGVVAVPGYDASLVSGGLLQHCIDYGRVSYMHYPIGTTYTDALTQADSYVSTQGKYQALLHPWVTVPGVGSASLTVPPTGYWAAKRALVHREIGAWRPPAGEIAAAQYVNGVEQRFTTAEASSLDAANVSVIRRFGDVVEGYGYRSLSTDEATFPLLSKQDANNVVARDAEALLNRRVFANIDSDGVLFETIRADLIGYLDPIRAAGGLYALVADDGTQLDPGYQVVVDSSNNSAESLARNEVHVKVGLRWSPVAELIYLDIVSVGLRTAF